MRRVDGPDEREMVVREEMEKGEKGCKEQMLVVWETTGQQQRQVSISGAGCVRSSCLRRGDNKQQTRA